MESIQEIDRKLATEVGNAILNNIIYQIANLDPNAWKMV